VKNQNGIRFLLKKHEPKVEVVFVGTEGRLGGQGQYGQPGFGQPAPGAGQYATQETYHDTPTEAQMQDNKWVTALDPTPASFGHDAVPVNEHLLLFGGFADLTTQNHTLLLHTSPLGTDKTAKIFQLRVRGDVPPPRERHTMSCIGKRIYIFGGYNRSSDLYYNTLYMFDTETLTYHRVEPRGEVPERRCGHTASIIDGRIWVFGGRVKVKKGDSFLAGSGVQYRNDLYCFDPTTVEWTRYDPRGIGPSGRAMATATVVGRKIYFFGGANSTGSRRDTTGFCDLYELDIDTMTWAEVETRSTPPQPCYGHTANYIGDNKLLVFGGKGYTVTNAIHIFNLATNEWKPYAYAGNPLVCRWGHTASIHYGHHLLIFGGRNDNGYWNTWDNIDLEKQLIEYRPEDALKFEKTREQDMKTWGKQALSQLQLEVEELQSMVSQLGDELLNQQTEGWETAEIFSTLQQSQTLIRQRANLLFGQ